VADDVNLTIRLKGDDKGFVGTVNLSNDAVRKFSQTLDKNTLAVKRSESGVSRLRNTFGKINTRLFSVKSALAGVIASLGLREVLDSTRAWQGYYSSLTAATGSQAQAAKEINFVRLEANRLGLELSALLPQYTQLAAASKGTVLEGQATRDIFSSVSEAAKVMQLSADDSAGALRAISQIMSKGTVQAEELRGQLGERIPGAFQIAARAMGVTTEELNKMLQTGSVLAEDLLPRFGDELRKSVSGGLPQAVGDVTASVSRMSNAWNEFLKVLGEAGLNDLLQAGADNLATFFNWAQGAVFKMAGGFKTAFLQIKKVGSVVGIALQHLWTGVVNAIKNALGGFFDVLANISDFGPLKGFSQDFRQYANDFSGSVKNIGSFQAALRKSNAEIAAEIKSIDASTAKKIESLKITDSAAKKTNKQTETLTKNTLELAKAEQALLDKLNPTDAAFRQYTKNLATLVKLFTENKLNANELEKNVSALTDNYQEFSQKASESARAQQELLDRLNPADVALKQYNKDLATLVELFRRNELDAAGLAKNVNTLTANFSTLNKKIDKTKKDVPELSEGFKNLQRGLQTTFADTFKDIFDNGISGFEDFGQRLKSLFTSILAELAAKAATEKLIVPILLASGGVAQAGTNGAQVAGGINPALGVGLLAGGFIASTILSRRAQRERKQEEEARRLAETLQRVEDVTFELNSTMRLLSGSTSEVVENLQRADYSVRTAFTDLLNANDVHERTRAEESLFEKVKNRYDLEKELLNQIAARVNDLTSSLQSLGSANIDARSRVTGIDNLQSPGAILSNLLTGIRNPTLESDFEIFNQLGSEKAVLETASIAFENLSSIFNEKVQNEQNATLIVDAVNDFISSFNDNATLTNLFGALEGDYFTAFPGSSIGKFITQIQSTLDDDLENNAGQTNIAIEALITNFELFGESADIVIENLKVSREEVVRWAEAQRRLANTMKDASDLISDALNNIAYSQLSPAGQVQELQNRFSSLVARGKTAEGLELANIAKQTASLGPELLRLAKDSFGTGQAFQSISGEVVNGLKETQQRVDELTPSGFEDAALEVLDAIDLSINSIGKDLERYTQAIINANNGGDERLIAIVNQIADNLGISLNVSIITPDGEVISQTVTNNINSQVNQGDIPIDLRPIFDPTLIGPGI